MENLFNDRQREVLSKMWRYCPLQKVRLLYINRKIIDEYALAGYCPTCNQYIILKCDSIKIKQKGVLLCEIID